MQIAVGERRSGDSGPGRHYAAMPKTADEVTLANDIAFVQPTDLSLSDCMHRLIALDGSRRAFGRPEPEAGGDALLDESMIVLDDVVHVRRSSVQGAAFKNLPELEM